MPVVPLTQADLLAIVDRLLPESFIDPLKRIGPGYELLQAAASVFARASQAVVTLDNDTFIQTASSGGFALAQVIFTRAHSKFPTTIIIKAGTVVTASATGRSYVLLADVTLLAAGFMHPAQFVTLPCLVQAVAETYEYNNCLGPRTAANGEIIAGDIDTITNLVTDPPYGDPSITVSQYSDASGGSMDDLDTLGTDLGMPRLPNETDAAYRVRLQQLPDVVSPGAIQRTIQAFFQQFAPAGAQWALTFYIETWQLNYCTAFDVPNIDSLPAGSPLANAALNSCFFYDDTRGPGDPNIPNPSGYFGRWLGLDDYRGAFIVVVPLLAALNDQGMFYDDPGTSPVGGVGVPAAPLFETPLGTVGASFYDATGLDAPNGFYDGQDLARAGIYTGLNNLLYKIKAGGVCVEIVLYGLT